jgi:glutathione S-transferase
MLTLYHNAVSVCSQKVRIQLIEKGIAHEDRHVNLMAGEQTRPEFLAINPRGLVPALVHDGEIVIESTVIMEYIEDVFPQAPLRPEAPAARARMRVWAKVPDDGLHTSCATVSFAAIFAQQLAQGLGPEALERRFAGMPDQERANRQRALLREGFKAPFAKAALLHFKRVIGDMEQALAKHRWLAAESFSLADIAMIPYIERLYRLNLGGYWAERPRVADWFSRVQARPSYQTGLTEWRPRDYDDLLRDRGVELWPQVGRCSPPGDPRALAMIYSATGHG